MATTAKSSVKPPVTAAQAQAALAALYGIEGTAQELTGELDRNFLIKTPTDERYVLKVYHQAADPAVLDFQNRALAHVASRDPSVGVATVMPDRDGRETASLTLPDGSTRLVRLLSWIPGSLMADATTVRAETLESLGGYLARLDGALADFSHPGQQRAILWAMSAAPQHRRLLEHIENTRLRDRVTGVLDRFESQVSPALRSERRQVIHHDANPHNVLIDDYGQAAAVIDFGDMVEDHLVAELAVACTYAMFGQADPVKAVLPLIAGYHEVNPLTDGELALLLDLVRTRLAQSICMSAWQHSRDPENEYLLVDRDDVTALLERLARVNDRFALFQFRAACGLPANPATPALLQWLGANGDRIGPICRHDLATVPLTVFDWTAGSRELAELHALRDVPARSTLLFQWLERAGSVAGVGRYLENRAVYTDRLFQTDDPAEPRSVHLGIDLFLPSREVVMAPLDGRVHLVANNPAPGDYGPMIVLEHPWDGGVFWTLYGHLSIDSLDGMKPGRPVARGDMIGRIGTFPTNGNWIPHLHFQIITDFVGRGADIEGVARASEVDVWESISPDPNIILGIRDPGVSLPSRASDRVLRERRRRLGRSLSLSYRQPIKMVRGDGPYLYDEAGNAWLDMVNNVCHVGHCHPRVVRAGQQQMAALNTNTRYLHDAIVEYSRRLSETLPEPLNVCFFVNSGSEANDLALRLARTHSGGSDVLVVDNAYHGNLTSLIELSPYKFNGPGGSGRPAHVRVCPMPDDYRGRWKRDDPEAGRRYAEQAVEQLERIQSDGRRLAAFFCESMLSCGGQIILPPGYLREVYAHIRAAGGVCVADEVQVGFGRAGSHMWAFETQDVVPDIVTLGKPIGNGHPLGAVITTPAIAASFANGMEYFNTFGGNPVSMAIGSAVLDVIRDERLQQHASDVGRQLLEGLEGLKARHRLIGDVRGTGLFIGVELVRDRASLEPADREAGLVVEAMKQRHILLSIDGPFHNVIKIKPPMVFDAANAAQFLSSFDQVLAGLNRA